MPKKQEDRRVRRTRQQLKEALLSLIREKGFEALTVQDIIDRANVGRSTFYAHFGGKADLLVQGLDELRDALMELQRRAAAGGGAPAFAFAHELLAHANEHRDVFRAMVGKRSGAVLQRRFQKMLTELLRQDVSAMLPRTADASVPVEAVVQFLASGLYGLMAWWLDGPVRLSVDAVTALFRRLATATVSAAPAPTGHRTNAPR